MSEGFPWRTAFKIAWRESRASPAKFLFVILAVAIGVGSLTGVRSFSRAFRAMLLREARTLMAADLTVRQFMLPTPKQVAVMERLEKQGVRRTRITETVSMISSAAVKEPLLVSVKAVDPAVYPFYGTIRLDPPGTLAEKLTADSVAVSGDLLLRLRVRVGDSIRLGGQNFRIVAEVKREPDRMTGTLNIGPRVMITREGLDRTGLITTGSRASERWLFRLPPEGPKVDEVRKLFNRTFPEARVVDFRRTHPLITHGLNRATTFLSLVSLIALIVGALGVAMAIHSHLEQRMDTIGIMKSLGARSGQIIRIYLLETLLLGLGGATLGILLGSAVEHVFPILIARYFSLQPDFRWDWVPAFQGLAIGTLTSLLFTLPPLLQIRTIRPTVIFRRDMAEPRPDWRTRLKEARASLAAAGVLLVGIGIIAAWLSDSFRTAGLFVGGVAAGLLVLSCVAWLLLRALRIFLRWSPWRLPVSVRHGIANLYRPGNHAGAVLVALGVGVMFTLTVYLVQRSVLDQLIRTAPPEMPNVFLINITDKERDGLVELLKKQPGVERAPEIVASIAAKLKSVNGVPIGKLDLERWGRRFLRTRAITWAAEKPTETEIVKGSWWNPGSPPAEPMISVDEDAARILGVEPGSRLEWTAAGRTIEGRVACLHRTERLRPGSSIEFIFSPNSLNGLPTIYYGGVRVVPRAVAELQKNAYERFPTVTVINVADVLEIVQGVVDQIALVTRFVSVFAILAGAVILASSVAGTRFRRIREVAILKTLGATRNRVARIFSVEFLVLGGVAGLMGSLLATGFSALALNRLFDSNLQLDVLPNLLAIVLTAVIASFAGWLASFRILGQKPLEVLRNE